MVEGTPHVRNSLAPASAVPHPSGSLPRMELVTATLGNDGLLLEGLDGRIDGLVITAFGAGHVPQT